MFLYDAEERFGDELVRMNQMDFPRVEMRNYPTIPQCSSAMSSLMEFS
jgi:hypothetical protein